MMKTVRDVCLTCLLTSLVWVGAIDYTLRRYRDEACPPQYRTQTDNCMLLLDGKTMYYGYEHGKAFRIKVK